MERSIGDPNTPHSPIGASEGEGVEVILPWK